MKSVLRNILVKRPALHVITGPAGSGKTYEVCVAAKKAVQSREVRRIVVTRPVVTVGGEDIGHLPGTMSQKMDPYMAPMYQFLDKSPAVHPIPLGFMRGMTFEDSFIIADEAQNMTLDQIRCLVSRIGPGSNICITGDLAQTDLAASGLETLVERIHMQIPEYAIHTELTSEDVVRHEAIPELLDLTRPMEN